MYKAGDKMQKMEERIFVDEWEQKQYVFLI